MEKTAVTSVCWVPRGRLRATPVTAEGNDDDEEVRAAHDGLTVGASSSTAAPNMDGLEEFNMDGYDDETADNGMQFFSVLDADGDLARGKDPHMEGDPDSDSDSEDYHELKAEDYIYLATSCEEESCMLELYVYEDDEANMYVHHDLMLGAYPLCVEFVNRTESIESGSFAAVGLFNHTIELWDLDRLDAMEPCQLLGEMQKAKTAKGKKSKKKGTRVAHDGPILCLSGSPFNQSVIASGAADETVKVWDIAENACVHAYTHHENKVQCVKWHTTEKAVLLSAAFDKGLALLDVRQPGQVHATMLPGEAECAFWSRHSPFHCFASVDNGTVVCYDVRKVAEKAPEAQRAVWSLQAHSLACTGADDTPTKDLLVTASLDGSAKVWNTAGGAPSMVFSKDLQAGPLFTCASSAEAPGLVSFGGKCPVVWDLTSEELLHDAFNFGVPRPSEIVDQEAK